MHVRFASPGASVDALAAPIFDGKELSAAAQALDVQTQGALSRALKAQRVKGAAGQVVDVLAPAGLEAGRVVLAGLGPATSIDPLAVETCAASVVRRLVESGAERLELRLDGLGLPAATIARAGLAARLAAWRFDKYRKRLKPERSASLTEVIIACDDPAAAEDAWTAEAARAEGVSFARELVAEPANILHPEEFSGRLQGLAALGLEIKVLGEAEMRELGMGALLGVGQGSSFESQLVIMEWRGAGDAQPVAFVGKGVCFDAGGLSIKPAQGMDEMKGDMGGAAAVSGVMKTLALRKAPVNVIGVVGLVENAVDANSQRPGDIVTTMSGQTVEVLNTDAEGRLVLSDAIHYTIERYKPKFLVDMATLTGAVIVALGHYNAGLFCNNDALADAILKAGRATGEGVWRLPLGPLYDKMIDSPNADIKNISDGRAASSITAAQFIGRFVGETPWAHLDIAGTAWRSKSENPKEPHWATGYGVRLLDQLAQDAFPNAS